MRRSGPWSAEETHRFLRDALVPVRVACHGASGHPVIASLWYLSLDGHLWCATQRSARVVRLLTDEPRCGFEVSLERPPYRGVRGAATARLHEDRGEEILRALLERYLAGSNVALARDLLEKVDTETAIELIPSRLTSWDFRGRMEPAA